jgi:hypothetical protein
VVRKVAVCRKFEIYCDADNLVSDGDDGVADAGVGTKLPTRKKRAMVLAGGLAARQPFSKEHSKWMIIEGYKERDLIVKNLMLTPPPPEVVAFQRDFRGVYIGKDFRELVHYEVVDKEFAAYEDKCVSVGTIVTEIATQTGQTKTVPLVLCNYPERVDNRHTKLVKSLDLIGLALRHFFVEGSLLPLDPIRSNYRKSFGWCSNQNTKVVDESQGIPIPRILEGTGGEAYIFDILTKTMDQVCDDFDLPKPFSNDPERTHDFAGVLHPYSRIESAHLVMYLLGSRNLMVKFNQTVLGPHLDDHNDAIEGWTDVVTVWEHCYLPSHGWLQIGLVGTSRRSVSDFKRRHSLVYQASKELMEVYLCQPEYRRVIVPETRCSSPDHAEVIDLHFDPMVHISVLLHGASLFKNTPEDRLYELVNTFFMTPNPILFMKFCLGLSSRFSHSIPDRLEPLQIVFVKTAMLENGGIAAGDCMRYVTSLNNPLGEDDVYRSNVVSKACVALANSLQPSRVKYTKVYNYVKKNLRGYGMLLSQKYIVTMTHLHLIRDSRWLAYSTPGSTKTLDRLRNRYGNEFTSLNVQQVIGSISCMLKVPEPTAEEILCLGLRILFKKLTKTDVVFPKTDFYGTDLIGGKIRRVVLPHAKNRWEEARPPRRSYGRMQWSIRPVAELANPRILYICHQSQARLHNLEKSVIRKGDMVTNISKAIQVAKAGKYLLVGLPGSLGIRGLVDSGRSADMGHLWSVTTLPELAAKKFHGRFVLGVIEYGSREGDVPTTTGMTYVLGILDATNAGTFFLGVHVSGKFRKPVRCESR